jgi:hypothetical protein
LNIFSAFWENISRNYLKNKKVDNIRKNTKGRGGFELPTNGFSALSLDGKCLYNKMLERQEQRFLRVTSE